jgi:ABC-2 type transport system permease protein
MEDVSYTNDIAADAGADRRKRIGAQNWQAMPDFRFVAPDGRTLAADALPDLAIVLGWLLGAVALLALATRRLGARQ